MQAHISHTFPNRMWVGMHGAWFAGGDTRVQGKPNPDEQRNTRLGATLSLPLARFHSVKVVYSTGDSTRRGTDLDSFSVNWQFAGY